MGDLDGADQGTKDAGLGLWLRLWDHPAGIDLTGNLRSRVRREYLKETNFQFSRIAVSYR